jgi:phosphotransferase system HPr (HPr) family protein
MFTVSVTLLNNSFFLKSRHFVIHMGGSAPNYQKTVIIPNCLGIHARPAGMIAKLAKNAESVIWIIKDGDRVDASSIIDILSLLCTQGASVTLEVTNQADKKILNKIITLIEKGFRE